MSGRTYSRKLSTGCSLDDPSSRKRLRQSPSLRGLLDELAFLLVDSRFYDWPALARLTAHPAWIDARDCEQAGERVAQLLLSPSDSVTMLSPLQCAVAAAVVPQLCLSSSRVDVVLSRASLSLPDSLSLCCRVLESSSAQAASAAPIAALIAAAAASLRSCDGAAAGAWLELLECASRCPEGRQAARDRPEDVDAWTARLAHLREDGMFRVLVNVCNGCPHTAARMCKRQDAMLACHHVLSAEPSDFDSSLLALALASNLCEQSSRARHLCRILGLVSLAAARFLVAARDELEGNVVAGHCAILLVAASYEDPANAAAVAEAVPGGLSLLCHTVQQFCQFQAELGLLPDSSAAAYQRLIASFDLDDSLSPQ